MTLLTRVLSALILSVGLMSPAKAQQTYEMTLTHALSENSSFQMVFDKFGELVKERSNGRITVNGLCCSQAGAGPRAVQAIRTGVIAGGLLGGAELESVVRAYRVLSLPYLWDDNAQVYKVLQSKFGDEVLSLLDPIGMVGMGWAPAFERDIASRKPINSLDDMKGLKIRVLQAPGFVEAYKALGAQPTPMAYGEVFMALQNGVVDAIEASTDAVVADRFMEVVKNVALTKVHQATTVFVLSKSFYDSLPDDLKTIVRTSAREALDYANAHQAKLAEGGLKTIKERGVAINEPDLAPFKEAARKSYDTILAGDPDARQLLEKIEAAKKAQ